jgi:predicted enzyme related to lactoylglutathione lyase
MDPIVHFEIPVDDLDQARKFYGPIFGWKLNDWNMPDGSTYVGAHTTAIDEKTRMPGVWGPTSDSHFTARCH